MSPAQFSSTSPWQSRTSCKSCEQLHDRGARSGIGISNFGPPLTPPVVPVVLPESVAPVVVPEVALVPVVVPDAESVVVAPVAVLVPVVAAVVLLLLLLVAEVSVVVVPLVVEATLVLPESSPPQATNVMSNADISTGCGSRAWIRGSKPAKLSSWIKRPSADSPEWMPCRHRRCQSKLTNDANWSYNVSN